MKVGDRVLERYLLTSALPAPEGQLRFAAVDEATGAPAEVIGPTAQVALRPGAEPTFQRARQPLAGHPALLDAGPVGRADGRPAAARPPTAGPLPAELRLDPEDVRAWAAWLGPAAAAIDAAVGGRLGPEDLVVDADGVVRISPAGLAQPRERVRPDRWTGLSGSALHGLGTLLFEALVGAPPPPDGRGARDLDPSVPDDIDALLDALRSPSSSAARAAVQALPDGAPVVLQAAATPTSSPPLPTARPDVRPIVRTTRDAPPPPTARVDAARRPWAVVTWPSGLTGAARRRAAALADVPLTRVDALAAAELPLVLEAADDPATAGARIAFYGDVGMPAEVRSADPPTGPALRAAGAGVVAGGAVLAAMLMAPLALGLPQLLLPLIALCLVLGVPLGWLAVRSAGEARRRLQLDRARDVAAADASGRAEAGQDEALAAIRDAHRRILTAELAVPVRLDLEGALDDLRAELDAPEGAATGSAGIIDLAQDIGDAAAPAPAGRSAEQLEADLRRRAQAARAAAAELHRRR